jgi:hypothetical protein
LRANGRSKRHEDMGTDMSVMMMSPLASISP